MPFTVVNSVTAADASLVAVMGLRAYFRPTGDPSWHDFGHVATPTREQELTELEIKSARLGKLATVKKLTTEVSLEYTFQSMSVLDQETVALHSGGAAGAGLIGADAFYAVEEFLGTEGELLLVQPNAEAGGVAKVAYYPLAQLKGDGEESGDGESAALLTFRATVLQDETYVIPAGLDVATPAAPYGFRYFVVESSLTAVLDAIGS